MVFSASLLPTIPAVTKNPSVISGSSNLDTLHFQFHWGNLIVNFYEVLLPFAVFPIEETGGFKKVSRVGGGGGEDGYVGDTRTRRANCSPF